MSNFSIKALKDHALVSLEGNWSDAAIVTFVFYFITLILSEGITSFIGNEGARLTVMVLYALICAPLTWGFVVMFLDFIRGDKLRSGKLFDGYKGNWMRIFTTYLLVEIYTALWTLLLIVPGIIKSLSYSMTFFVLRDNPHLSNNAAIEKSMQLMDGHKMQLFRLYLSFIGWFILALLTLGIGFILLVPYVNTTLAHFYEQLKAEDFNERLNG